MTRADGFIAAMIGVEPKSGLSALPGGSRLAKGEVTAEVMIDTITEDFGFPTPNSLTPRNACDARRIVLVPGVIFPIDAFRHIPKVLYTIVASDAVDVVDLPFRPFPMNNSPYDAMGFMVPPENPSNVVALIACAKGFLASEPRIPNFPSTTIREVTQGSFFPEQPPGRAVIIEHVAQILRRRYSGISHVVSPHVRGQGRALLQQRFRPALFSKNSGIPQARSA